MIDPEQLDPEEKTSQKRARAASFGSDHTNNKSNKSKILSLHSQSDDSERDASKDMAIRKKNFFISAQQCNLDLVGQ
jgi:hypothetical protein